MFCSYIKLSFKKNVSIPVIVLRVCHISGTFWHNVLILLLFLCASFSYVKQYFYICMYSAVCFLDSFLLLYLFTINNNILISQKWRKYPWIHLFIAFITRCTFNNCIEKFLTTNHASLSLCSFSSSWTITEGAIVWEACIYEGKRKEMWDFLPHIAARSDFFNGASTKRTSVKWN